jgi:hypothetical protein
MIHDASIVGPSQLGSHGVREGKFDIVLGDT